MHIQKVTVICENKCNIVIVYTWGRNGFSELYSHSSSEAGNAPEQSKTKKMTNTCYKENYNNVGLGIYPTRITVWIDKNNILSN
jgi:hypothetical protein